MSIGCPILYTVHGKGVCEVGRSTRMSDDFIVRCFRPTAIATALEQVTPVLERAGYKSHLAHSPARCTTITTEVPGWMHADMWILPLDANLALIYPPWCDYETIRRPARDRLRADRGAARRESSCIPRTDHHRAPQGDHERQRTEDPARFSRSTASRSSPIEYDEVHKYGGGIRCNTMQLIRDPGPGTFTE